MKRIIIILVGSVIPTLVFTQSYSIDWYKIAGGGGVSTGGVYALSGTIGQPDAGASSGGTYSAQSGFWGFVSAIQTPDAPLLSIAPSGGSVRVFWPLPATAFLLEQASVLSNTPPGTAWSQVGYPYQTNATHISITVPASPGNKYYRLRKP